MTETKSIDDGVAELKKEHTIARKKMIESEQEIQAIKTALRRMAAGPASAAEGAESGNTLEIVLLKVDGLPAEAKPKFTLQLSSPIEEATLSKLFDPLKTDVAEDAAKEEQSLAKFQGVDTSVATLTVTALDGDKTLGASIAYDIAELCGNSGAAKKVADVLEKYTADFPVAILDDASLKTLAAADQEGETETKAAEKDDEKEEKMPVETNKSPDDDATGKQEEAQKDGATTDAVADTSAAKEAKESNEDSKADSGTAKDGAGAKADKSESASTSAVVSPICTATLRVTFKPSQTERKEKLHELLNELSVAKAKALETLRKVSTALVRKGGSGSQAGSQSSAKPAVKPGFLSRGAKGAAAKEKKSPLHTMQDRFFGPQSLFMKSVGILIFTRNYIIFFGAAAFFHFKGHMLSLPPPV